MNVHIAGKALTTLAIVNFKEYGHPETTGTLKYCKMFDKFFVCKNVRNTRNVRHFFISFLLSLSTVKK